MTTLSIQGAQQALFVAQANIEKMKDAQDSLASIGLLEDKDKGAVPAMPTLQDVSFGMAQKTLKPIAHLNSAAAFDLSYLHRSAFKEADKASETTSPEAGMAMLDATFKAINELTESSNALVEFMNRKEIIKAHFNLGSRDSLESCIVAGKTGVLVESYQCRKNQSETIHTVMQLAELTAAVSQEEIKKALDEGDYQHELFTTKTLKAGIKFQLKKEALKALCGALENIKQANAELEALAKTAKAAITSAMDTATMSAQTNAEYRAHLMESWKNRSKAA